MLEFIEQLSQKNYQKGVSCFCLCEKCLVENFFNDRNLNKNLEKKEKTYDWDKPTKTIACRMPKHIRCQHQKHVLPVFFYVLFNENTYYIRISHSTDFRDKKNKCISLYCFAHSKSSKFKWT